MKTRTCKRCNGSGMRNCGVVHMGVPGLCYGCNGSGAQVWVEAAVITAERQRGRDSHIAELRQSLAECEAGLAADQAKGRRGRPYIQWIAGYTESLATVSPTAEPATRGEWRPSARQAEKVGV